MIKQEIYTWCCHLLCLMYIVYNHIYLYAYAFSWHNAFWKHLCFLSWTGLETRLNTRVLACVIIIMFNARSSWKSYPCDCSMPTTVITVDRWFCNMKKYWKDIWTFHASSQKNTLWVTCTVDDSEAAGSIRWILDNSSCKILQRSSDQNLGVVV